MATKFSVLKPTNHHYHYHLLLPDFELLDPPPLFSPQPLRVTLQPFRRGPMYSTYAELRDRNLRAKKAKLGGSTPITPPPLKRSPASCSASRSLSFTKENRKPFPASAATLVKEFKPDLRKLGRASVERREKISFSRKSYSEHNVLKEISRAQEEKGGGWRGMLRKSVGSFERPKSIKAAVWIG